MQRCIQITIYLQDSRQKESVRDRRKLNVKKLKGCANQRGCLPQNDQREVEAYAKCGEQINNTEFAVSPEKHRLEADLGFTICSW